MTTSTFGRRLIERTAHIGLLVSAATASLVAPACAQDIVMRRPLPVHSTPTPTPKPTSQPDELQTANGWRVDCATRTITCYSVERDRTGTLTRQPVDPALCGVSQSAAQQDIAHAAGLIGLGEGVDATHGLETCAAPSPSPSPTPGDGGFGSEPSNEPTTEPDDGEITYSWDVGEWQGQATCGQQSEMTRRVSCTGDSWEQGRITVADHYCTDAVGPKPATRYTGDGAGCDYTPVIPSPDEVDSGSAPNPDHISVEWQAPEWGGGTATCSSDAWRNLPYTCQDQDGRTVDNRFCREQLYEGGTPADWLPQREYGNYRGCKAHWETKQRDLGCHAAGDPYGSVRGAVHYAVKTTMCVNEDGTVLQGTGEAACENDPDRPFDGIVTVGSCRMEARSSGIAGSCLASGGVIDRVTTMRQNRELNVDSTAFATACFNAGATCVASRSTADGNYKLEPNNTLQIICTGGEPNVIGLGSRFYNDECSQASDGECPTFHANDLYEKTWVPN